MSLPLEGKVVVVTRPAHQAEELAGPLRDLGAHVLLLPAIRIAPPEDSSPLDDALLGIDGYDWVVLTSVNGVDAVLDRMTVLGIPVSALASRKLATIGPATAARLTASVREPDLVPQEYVSEALSTALPDVAGKRFLLPRADIAREHLAVDLRARGAEVTEVAAYRILAADSMQELPETAPSYITFTSSSSVHGTVGNLRQLGRASWLEECALVSIGPITSQTLLEEGYCVAATATEYTVPGLVQAILALAKEATPVHA